MLLKVEDLHTYCADSHVLGGVSLEVSRGETIAILGRNGVGKSTTLKSIMGLVPPRSGSVLFRGEELARKDSYQIARKGIGYVPEERRIFPGLTVRENLVMGLKKGVGKDPKGREAIERVYARFPRLGERDGVSAGNLSGGEQQMLTLVRTLVGEPELMLIDEPCEGLSPLMAEAIFEMIREIRTQGIAVILVDRNLPETCGMADRVYIMVKGAVVYQGSGKEVLGSREIQEKYLAV